MTSKDMYSAPFRKPINHSFLMVSRRIPMRASSPARWHALGNRLFLNARSKPKPPYGGPAQRPINVFIDSAAQTQKPWIDSIQTHQALVEKFWKLGFVEPVAGASSP